MYRINSSEQNTTKNTPDPPGLTAPGVAKAARESRVNIKTAYNIQYYAQQRPFKAEPVLGEWSLFTLKYIEHNDKET